MPSCTPTHLCPCNIIYNAMDISFFWLTGQCLFGHTNIIKEASVQEFQDSRLDGNKYSITRTLFMLTGISLSTFDKIFTKVHN